MSKMEISVVIPTYNRAAALAATLENLRNLEGTAGLAWEIIVVDNNSNDDTSNVTESFASRSGLNVRYVFEKVQGASYARNRGIQASKGEIVIFVDDDIVIPAQWLLEMKKAFEDYQAACVGGKVLVDKAMELPPWWDERFRAPLSVFDLGDEIIVSNQDRPVQDELAIGSNVGFRVSALVRNGGFRTDIGRFGNKYGGGEDSELVLRFQRNGERVVYYPRAAAYHSPDVSRFTENSLPDFFYNYGITCCQIDLLFPGTGPRIAGIPRWKYRWLLESSLKSCWRILRGNSKEALYYRMSLYKNWGYLQALLKTKRASLTTAQPEQVLARIP